MELQDKSLIDGNGLGILDIFITLAKYKRMVMCIVSAFTLIAGVVALLMPNIYTATAQIMPPQQNESSMSNIIGQLGSLGSGLGGGFGLKNQDDLYVGILNSRRVTDAIIANFKLQTIYGVKNLTEARDRLKKASHISYGKDNIINISVDDKNPQFAAKLANAYVNELTKVTSALAFTEASKRRLFFENEVRNAKEALSHAEVNLQQFQEKSGVIKLENQSQATIEAIAKLHAEIAAKEVVLKGMSSYATTNNPDYQRTISELDALKNQLVSATANSRQSDTDVLLPTGSIPSVGLNYLRLLRNVKYQETIFNLLEKQYEIAKVDEAKDPIMIQVLDQAIAPEVKSMPHRMIIVFVASIGSLALSIILACMLDYIGKIKRSEAGAQQLNLLIRFLKGAA